MCKKLLTRKEVAELLCIGERTLATYGGTHEVYRADSAGLYHVDHVEIMQEVRAGIITPKQGMDVWAFKRMCMRRSMLQVLQVVEGSRKGRRRGERRSENPQKKECQ